MSLLEQVEAAIRNGDAKAVRKLLAGKSEKERTALSGAMAKTFDLAHKLVFSRDGAKAAAKLGVDFERKNAEGRSATWDVVEAARIALTRTMTSAEAISKHSWRSVPSDDDVVFESMKDRPAELVRAWVEKVSELTYSRWWALRRLVREGICENPDTDAYVLGMVVEAHFRLNGWEQAQKKRRPLFDEDPALLEKDLWRIFEVEGTRDASLTGVERLWTDTLLGLAESGRIERGRLLDATLSALSRDFAQHKAGFYSRLHDALKPTPKEMAKRASAYVELLGSRIAPTVSLATRVVESLPANVDLDPASFVRSATSAARSARGQSTALALLRLLDAKRGEADALDAVVAFLEHSSVDVIDAAMTILEASKPNKALVVRVAALVPTIPASRRARVQAWAGGGKAEKTDKTDKTDNPDKPDKPTKEIAPTASAKKASPADAKRAGIAALAKAPPQGPWPRVTLEEPAPRLDPSRAVTPIADVDELLAAAARALEEPNDRVNYERVLDGVSRLGAPLSALPKDAIKPLAKRAAKLCERHSTTAAVLINGWLTGNDGRDVLKSRHSEVYINTRQFGLRRVQNVLKRLAAGKTAALLSMPSTEGFFVDPIALATKVKTHEGDDLADAVTALLRLAPEHRPAALKKLTGIKGELASAVRHALGSDAEKPGKKDAPLWYAAARARGGDDAVVKKAFPKAGADAGEAARLRFFWKKTVSNPKSSWATLQIAFEPAPPKLADIPPDAYSVMLATDGMGGHGAQFGGEDDLREMASNYPSNLRTLLAHGVERISGNVDFGSSAWENHVFIEALIDPDVPLDDVGLYLLAIATNTKEARENALATDALIAAITDGRVVGPELGVVMATYWDPLHEEVRWSRRPTAGRWAKTFGVVAQTSVLHAEVVRRTLEAFFGAAPVAPPADLNVLLQLWLDLATEAAIGVPVATRDVLAKYTGKAKKIATQLLALEGTTSAHAEEAHAHALDGRHTRGARWTSWAEQTR